MQQSVLMLINNIWREQMPKFKTGDKVRVVSGTGRLWYSDRIGQEFTVETCMERLYENYYTTVENGGGIYTVENGGGIYERDLELVTTPKSMLKNGMRVKCRNDSMWTYLDGVFVAVTSDFSDDNYLEHMKPVNSPNWTDDLINDFGERFDVMEIFDAPSSVFLYFAYNEETQSIWKRVEKSEAELRLEQMQAKAAELQNEMAKLQKDIAEGKA